MIAVFAAGSSDRLVCFGRDWLEVSVGAQVDQSFKFKSRHLLVGPVKDISLRLPALLSLVVEDWTLSALSGRGEETG